MSELVCSRAGEIGMITQKIDNIEKQLVRDERAHDKIVQDLEKLSKVYDVIHTLSTNVAIIATETRSTKESVNEIKSDVKTLSDDVERIKLAPVEDVRYYKRVVIGAVLLLILGAFMAGKLFTF